MFLPVFLNSTIVANYTNASDYFSSEEVCTLRKASVFSSGTRRKVIMGSKANEFP